MKFTHYDLGQVQSSSVAVVTLKGSAADVRLLDSSNFSSCRAGRAHRCIGA
jgi:DNA-binding helix-hairpin-helix protein with protein kinase domain